MTLPKTHDVSRLSKQFIYILMLYVCCHYSVNLNTNMVDKRSGVVKLTFCNS